MVGYSGLSTLFTLYKKCILDFPVGMSAVIQPKDLVLVFSMKAVLEKEKVILLQL